MLTTAEADAFCADYLEEKSVRAGVARVLLRLVAVVARMTTEMEELKRAENSESLWKLHSDSLIVLLEIGRTVDQNATRVMTLAEQRGAKVEADKIRAPLQKLLDGLHLAEKTLSGTPPEKSLGATSSS
jgi:trimethylamine:corrinoid methyltransferase-like protein